MQLTDQELRDVLARAEEIDRTSRRGSAWNAEVEAVIGAGVEVGLSREAVERALAERLNLPAGPPVVGALTWARSADGKFYVAEVLSVSEQDAQVRFLRGSEHRLGFDELRPCTFMPGQRLAVHWPSWGPWTCTVLSYDAASHKVKLSDGWGYTKTFPVAEVWLAPPAADERARGRLYAKLLGVGAAAGAIIGALVAALVIG